MPFPSLQKGKKKELKLDLDPVGCADSVWKPKWRNVILSVWQHNLFINVGLTLTYKRRAVVCNERTFVSFERRDLL